MISLQKLLTWSQLRSLMAVASVPGPWCQVSPGSDHYDSINYSPNGQLVHTKQTLVK